MSNVLVVHAHPEPKSLTSALKNLAVETLTAQGHTVQVSDLYAAKWKAVADRGDFLGQANRIASAMPPSRVMHSPPAPNRPTSRPNSRSSCGLAPFS
ncbi:putative NADPH-quinone reductase [Bradyrhizobium algeriense]|uniref:NADPH-quinone reductase n=1 Tax=Bradyrhizobium algeriense TaxID=634784 RepID=A0ABU8BAL8_9BRAD